MTTKAVVVVVVEEVELAASARFPMAAVSGLLLLLCCAVLLARKVAVILGEIQDAMVDENRLEALDHRRLLVVVVAVAVVELFVRT